MKKLNYIWIVLLITILGCGNDWNPTDPSDFEEASAQKQFVWNAMNYWYYWQGDIPELGDNYFSDDEAFHEYLNGFSDAETLFNSLLYVEDDFSFFIEDHETFEQSQKGISQSFGYEFGLVRISQNSDEIFGYVQYVLANSPADDAGLERGDIFTSVDGTRLTVNNYQDLLLGTTSYVLTMAEIVDGTITETDETVSLEAQTLTENPIFTSAVFDTNSTKVGYLMYNAFQLNSHQNLNDAFGTFESEGVDELIVDLRYNGGGTGITSQALGSMIAGLDSSNVFSTYAYNDKRSQYNSSVYYIEEVPIYDENQDQESTEPINALSMNKAYILTGHGTASASEMLVNALEPYIDVILIGRQTVGKDEGSYTLYDTPTPPYLDQDAANLDHKIAIQPIAIKVVNRDGRDYPDGFAPDHEINELSYLEEGLLPLGDPDEPLLGQALALITGQKMAKMKDTDMLDVGSLFKDSKDLKPYEKGLYITPETVETPNF